MGSSLISYIVGTRNETSVRSLKHRCLLSFSFCWHVAHFWLRPKNHPANIIIRYLTNTIKSARHQRDIQLLFFFSFLLLVFILCSHSSIHGSNFSARWCRAKALLICALPTSENTSCRANAGSSGCKHLLAFCKKYTSLHSPMYTTNLKWQMGEVRVFDQAGAERKQHSKRAKIILWLVKMNWRKSSEWLWMSCQKKKAWLAYNSLVCVFARARICARVRKMLLLTWMEGRELRLKNIII